MVYKVAILGSGPAGLTAGIYTARAQLSTVIIEGPQPGGQLMTTTNVENWPGNTVILGPDLMTNMREHAKKSGCHLLGNTTTKVDFNNYPFTITFDNNQIVSAESVIIATGSSHKKLGCKGETEYWGNGVSVCATCDAPFYKDKEVVVVGGGNSAIVEAEHLSNIASKVTIISLLGQLTATDPLKFKVLENKKITIKYQTIVREIQGDELGVTQVITENTQTKKTEILKTDGVFIAIGFTPNTQLFKGILDLDDHGYIKTETGTKTSVDGIFAAGEVSDSKYRQAVTSAGFGCMAALECQNWLQK